MKSGLFAILGVLSVGCVKNRIGSFSSISRDRHPRRNLEVLSPHFQNVYWHPATNGLSAYDSHQAGFIKLGMMKFSIPYLPEFAGLINENAVIWEYLNILESAGDSECQEEMSRALEITSGLVRFGFLEPTIYFSVFGMLHNYDQEKFKEIKRKISLMGYFIIDQIDEYK
jgi:hypothetical protein